MRSDRFSTDREIKNALTRITKERPVAGPTLFTDENDYHYALNTATPIAFYGQTGSGKSNALSLFLRNCIDARESMVVSDSKGEHYAHFAGYCKAKGYRIMHCNLRSPALSPDGFNPIEPICILLSSDDLADRDLGNALLENLVSSLSPDVNPNSSSADPFWTNETKQTLRGIIHALAEIGEEEEYNVLSLIYLLTEAEGRNGVGGTNMEGIYRKLDPNGLAKQELSAYVNAPKDTKMSIFTCVSEALSIFMKSEGLQSMLCHPTIYLDDEETPFVLFITLPDEHHMYHKLAGTMITMLSFGLISLAQTRNGRKLNRRVTFFLEELGTTGKAIPNLPDLMIAARSRNIRMVLVLQDSEQLSNIYGKEQAEAISSCVTTSIAFSTNNTNSRETFSKMTGTRIVEHNHMHNSENLLSPRQIGAMKTGQGLVFLGNRQIYVYRFPLFEDTFNPNLYEFQEPLIAVDYRKDVKCFRPSEFQQRMTERNKSKQKLKNPEDFWIKEPPTREERESINLEALMADIDRKIAELEAEEKAQEELAKKGTVPFYPLDDDV